MAVQGGQVRVHYDSGSPILLWQKPANFNRGSLSHSQTFSPPAGASQMWFGYKVTLDKDWLAFSNASLEWHQPAYTITRKTYLLGGVSAGSTTTIATRASGDPAGETGKNGLFYIHSDHLGSNSVMSYGQGHASNLVGKEVAGSRGRYYPYHGWRPCAVATSIAMGLAMA